MVWTNLTLSWNWNLKTYLLFLPSVYYAFHLVSSWACNCHLHPAFILLALQPTSSFPLAPHHCIVSRHRWLHSEMLILHNGLIMIKLAHATHMTNTANWANMTNLIIWANMTNQANLANMTNSANLANMTNMMHSATVICLIIDLTLSYSNLSK